MAVALGTSASPAFTPAATARQRRTGVRIDHVRDVGDGRDQRACDESCLNRHVSPRARRGVERELSRNRGRSGRGGKPDGHAEQFTQCDQHEHAAGRGVRVAGTHQAG